MVETSEEQIARLEIELQEEKEAHQEAREALDEIREAMDEIYSIAKKA